MENSDNSAKLIGALIAGAAIGAVIGILFAPDKGSETRKKVMDGAADLADKFKDILNTSTAKEEEGNATQAEPQAGA
jgi:gas vesicle protein